MEEEIREKEAVTETTEATSVPKQEPQIVETSQQETQSHVKEWHEIFSEFFTKVSIILYYLNKKFKH